LKKLFFRKAAGKLHLWLGLCSGIIVLIISLTGCIYVFQQELSELWYRDKLYAGTVTQEKTLPLNQLWANAQAALNNNEKINRAYIYKEPGKTWSFLAYRFDPYALTYFGNFVYYKSVQVNPYNGKIAGIIDLKYDFFNIIKYIHWSLLLNTIIGQPIVGWSTIIFILMIITGLILWWPRNKNAVKQRFVFDFKGKRKKNIYNLHSIGGFYIILLVLTIAITGLVYAFTWVEKAVHIAATGKTSAPAKAEIKSYYTSWIVTNPLQKALESSQNKFPEWQSIYTAGLPEDSTGAIYMNINMRHGTYYKTNDLYFDKYTGALLRKELYANLSTGEKFINMNYDIHVGAIGGIATKVLAFFVSLTAASLPVTGFLIWKGRKKK
jgi:uncharacterized iron-regulated membrane protein